MKCLEKLNLVVVEYKLIIINFLYMIKLFENIEVEFTD